MAEPRTVRCYQYVNRSYDRVREVFHRDPSKLLQRATTSAAARAQALIANLHVQVAGIDLGVDVRVVAPRVHDGRTGPGSIPVTTVDLSWEATRMPALFPTMNAELSAQPLSASETQLEILGSYRLPLGLVGNALDAAIGHRVAEATVYRLMEDIVEQLREELP